MTGRIAPLLLALSCASPIYAQDDAALALPRNAELTAEITEPTGRYLLPRGAFTGGAVPTGAHDGAILRQAWRIDAPDLATAQIIAPLREQLLAQGYAIILDCETHACGGFDFRFGTDVLSPPAMYVDLGDFRFLSALRPTGEAASVLVSRSPRAGFVQIIRLSPAGIAAPPEAETDERALRAPSADMPTDTPAGLPADFGAALEGQGRVVLSDLAFPSGAADLGPGEFVSLAALASYLRADPDRQVALVGHTDATGSLDGNIALSRRRAASVVARLVQAYDISAAQMVAEGMGYLAPLATNLTPEGRAANRRVEVILTSTP